LVRIVTALPLTVALAVIIVAEEVLAGVVAAVVGAVVGALVAAAEGVLPVVEADPELPQATARSASNRNGTNRRRKERCKNIGLSSSNILIGCKIRGYVARNKRHSPYSCL
jgi:hypothetical protein